MTHFDPKIAVSGRTGRVLRRLALGLGIALAVALAGTALVRQLGDDSPAPKPPGASTTPADEVVLAGAHLPISPDAGPRVVRNGLAKGFTHDPKGAAFAALHLSLRVTPQVGPDIYGPTFASQVVDGAALRSVVDYEYFRLQQAAGTAYGKPVGRVGADARGYRVDAVDAHAAAVRLLMHARDASGGDALASFAITLRWVDGDWALVAPADGDWSSMVAPVGDASGFLPFRDR